MRLYLSLMLNQVYLYPKMWQLDMFDRYHHINLHLLPHALNSKVVTINPKITLKLIFFITIIPFPSLKRFASDVVLLIEQLLHQ